MFLLAALRTRPTQSVSASCESSRQNQSLENLTLRRAPRPPKPCHVDSHSGIGSGSLNACTQLRASRAKSSHSSSWQVLLLSVWVGAVGHHLSRQKSIEQHVLHVAISLCRVWLRQLVHTLLAEPPCTILYVRYEGAAVLQNPHAEA